MKDDLYLLLQGASHQAQHVSLCFRGPSGTEIKGNLPFGVQAFRVPLAAMSSTLVFAVPIPQNAEHLMFHTATGIPQTNLPP